MRSANSWTCGRGGREVGGEWEGDNGRQKGDREMGDR